MGLLSGRDLPDWHAANGQPLVKDAVAKLNEACAARSGPGRSPWGDPFSALFSKTKIRDAAFGGNRTSFRELG
jgi:hypothetical protein